MIKNAQEIRESTAIYTVIGEYVDLKKSGANYTGLCPFHNEKTPSFSVSPQKNIYKCFGCGIGGDAVHFLMEHKGLTYPEALEACANIARISVQYEEGNNKLQAAEKAKAQKAQREAYTLLLGRVHEQYPQPKPKEVEKLLGRAYTQETLNTFQLRWAPKTSHIKKTALAEESGEMLQELGILKMGEQGSYDFFRNRLLFPIFNHMGKLVAYGGRKPKTDANPKNPKYLNSPESLLYDKGKTLYGLYQTRRHIRKAEFAYIVEGYTDLITLYEYGIQNAVATCGTALTERQARLLKRFTDSVILLFDGDAAGHKAACKNIEPLLKAGIHVKVCTLDDKHDPDSFIRQHKANGFQIYVDEKTTDAVPWRVMLEWHDTDNFKKEKAYNLAAQLLSLIDSASLQETYIRELCKKGNMGSVRRILTDKLRQESTRLLKKETTLNRQQQLDVVNYGLYEQDNRYFICSDVTATGFGISNFIIKPVMLVVGSKHSKRIVEVVNEHEKGFTADIESDDFVQLNGFQKRVERMGNYLFTGKPEYFARIKAKVYANTPTCYPIATMGYHKEGFYTWGNGISVDGKFYPVNEYGIVEYNDTKYYLPAFSSVHANIKSDDEENQYEDEKLFTYNEGRCPTFYEWTSLMRQVHLDNGMLGVAWYCAALFRDIIQNKFSCFPHLNGFGPPGGGKSFMAWSIAAMFGKPKDPFNLLHGTSVGFFRRLAQIRNGAAWFDEYSNEVIHKRIEALKAAYDGAGREKGLASNDNRTTRTKVNSACIITGQQQPTQDIALFQRCITINFAPRKITPEQHRQASKLKEIEKTGILSQITSNLQKHRQYISDNFSQEFDRLKSVFTKQLEDEGHDIKERIPMNYLIPLTITALLYEKEQFAFDVDALLEFAFNNMVQQANSIYSEDELAIFWRIVDYLIAKRLIRHNEDIIVEERSSEKFRSETSRKEKRDIMLQNFPEPKTLVYVRFTKVHPEYQQQHQQTRKKLGLDLGALQYYLRTSDAYIGNKHGKKFNGKSKSCYVFDAEKLPIELPLTIEVGNPAD